MWTQMFSSVASLRVFDLNSQVNSKSQFRLKNTNIYTHTPMHKHIYILANSLDKHPSTLHTCTNISSLSLTHTHIHTAHLLSKVTLAPLPRSPSGFINPVICVCLFRAWSLLTQRSSTSCTPETRLDAAFPRAPFHPGQNGTAVLFSLLLRPLVQTFMLHSHKRPFAPEAPDLPPSGSIAGFQGQDQAEGHQSQICPLHWSLSIMVSRWRKHSPLMEFQTKSNPFSAIYHTQSC